MPLSAVNSGYVSQFKYYCLKELKAKFAELKFDAAGGKFKPDKVYIMTEDIFEDKIEKTLEGVKILSEEFEFTPEIKVDIVNEAEFIESGRILNELIKELNANGASIAVDLTPGRKAQIAAVLIPLSKFDVDHIYYLSVKTLKGVSKPYPMIQKEIQTLKDFIVEKKEAVKRG